MNNECGRISLEGSKVYNNGRLVVIQCHCKMQSVSHFWMRAYAFIKYLIMFVEQLYNSKFQLLPNLYYYHDFSH